MNSKKYPLYRLVPMLVVMGTIFFLSSKTGDEIKLPDIERIDLVAHAGIYSLLALAVLFAWKDEVKRKQPLKVWFITVAFCLLYGISDEFHQYFVPGRFVSALDVAADTLGPLVVCGLWWLWTKKSAVSKPLAL